MKEVVYTGIFSDIKEAAYLIIKRLFDIVAGLIGLIVLIPITIIIKIVSMCHGDFNNIFLVQDRIGKDGKEFKFYKFRSMVPNADEVLFKMLEEDKEVAKEYKINKKLKNDPRITKVGHFIRKTSIDELPQLLNVLKGDMSLIGNRPYLPREKEDMGKYYEDIIKTKPGITGYWQVSGRSDVSFKERLKLEQYYSLHYGLRMDIKIFFKTFGAVFGHKGAE
ncbi:MAG: sugar transferase [Bacilli bacterium]|nr:sugar transferase [Bacilli bacterium]